MQIKKNIIYIVNTEFQLMVAVNLSLSHYHASEFWNSIYCVSSVDRMSKDLNTTIDIIGEIIYIDKANFIKEINKIVQIPCDRFYFFQENSIYNKYMAYKLRKRGSLIALGPDGLKPYAIFNKKHELFSMVNDTIKDYRKLKKANLFLPALIPSRYYKYGSSKIIDEVWLYNIELFNAKANKTKAVLKEIPKFTPLVWETLKELFSFSNSILPKSDNVLFYINQPLWSKNLVDVEIDFLNQTAKLFSGHEIVIKLHPNTAEKTIERYREIPNIKLVRSKIPAELFIASFTNSIVFSGWSTALTIDSSQCSFYYFLDVFKKVNDLILNQMEIANFNHIQLISSPEQMSFPKKI